MPDAFRKVYLGDGAYVEVENGMLRLSCDRENGTHVIYLEPEIMQRLIEYYEAAKAQAKSNKRV